ncbi:TPA: hypothetical protein ACH3X2_000662 [Trebouxia sp. C0005]
MPDPVSSLTTTLSGDTVAGQELPHRIQLGSINMGDMVSHKELVVAVRTDYQNTREEFCDPRQSIAADNEEPNKMKDELKSLLRESSGVKLPSPTDAAQVASVLEMAVKQDAAVMGFGAKWLVSVQPSIPGSVLAQGLQGQGLIGNSFWYATTFYLAFTTRFASCHYSCFDKWLFFYWQCCFWSYSSYAFSGTYTSCVWYVPAFLSNHCWQAYQD